MDRAIYASYLSIHEQTQMSSLSQSQAHDQA